MSLLDILQMLNHLATILGIPFAIVLFMNEKAKERREREYGTYDALDEKYLEFLRLVMENPELDLYDLPLSDRPTLSPQQRIRQMAMFEILVSLLERAFLMYRDQSNKVKKAQWEGWNEYMRDWARRETFRELWQSRGDQYDQDFMTHLQTVIDGLQS